MTDEQLTKALAITPVVSAQNRSNLGDRRAEWARRPLRVTERLAFLPSAPIQDIPHSGFVPNVADRHRATRRQVVLAWLLARSRAMLPIPETAAVEHVEENMAAADLQLDEHEVEALTAAR